MSPELRRWQSFNNEQLLAVWNGMTVDDGIRYLPPSEGRHLPVWSDDERLDWVLIDELRAEADARGLNLPEG